MPVWDPQQPGRTVSRAGLFFVFVLFCLPLFFGLRSYDMETDEAFYSYAVDRILEVGDWLEPKYSPSDTQVFLEKPPLKFWIVAAPIKWGLLPADEFGLRFWDAVAGSLAFLYVFAIGSLLAGPICGGVAVLLLFTHGPLIFDHGLLTNNMEAPLLLCYCGGIFHFLKWARATPAHGGGHAVAVGLYFVLGFMTKFVAAIFLPPIVVGAALLLPRTRAKLVAEWKRWAGVSALALALIVPWFTYAQVRFGRQLWDVMLRDHIYTRFTTSLDPSHLHPWSYYYTMLVRGLSESGTLWLVVAGLAALAVQLVRQRWLEQLMLVAWMVPLVLISSGSSKLYHYAYPFLPPLTIAAGYVIALVFALAPPLLRRLLAAAQDALWKAVPTLQAIASHPTVNVGATALIAIAAALAVGTLIVEPVHITVGTVTLIKNSSFVRPIIVIVAVGLLTGRAPKLATLVVALVLASWMPAIAYRQTFPRLVAQHHPMRDARDCVLRVQAAHSPGLSPGLYVDSDGGMWHPIFYNFRRVQPWQRQQAPAPDLLDRALHDPTALRPSLVWEARYHDYLAGPDRARFTQGAAPASVPLLEYVLLLPGPYAVCGATSAP